MGTQTPPPDFPSHNNACLGYKLMSPWILTSIFTNTCIIIHLKICLLINPQKPTHLFKAMQFSLRTSGVLVIYQWLCCESWVCVVGTCGQVQSWPGTITMRWAASPARSSTATVGPQNAGADYYNINSHWYEMYWKFIHVYNTFLLNSICYYSFMFCFVFSCWRVVQNYFVIQ